jgi:hypothetical protein
MYVRHTGSKGKRMVDSRVVAFTFVAAALTLTTLANISWVFGIVGEMERSRGVSRYERR